MRLVQLISGRANTQEQTNSLSDRVNNWILSRAKERKGFKVYDIVHRTNKYGSDSLDVVVAVQYEWPNLPKRKKKK